MKLNNKGFTLIEILAVVVILAMLMVVMVPSVNTLINKNKQDNYENLKETIIKAAKVYLSDYRYEIVISGSCSSSTSTVNITSINNQTLTSSRLPIQLLVNGGNITTNQDGNILDPRDESKKMNLSTSYIVVKYQCDKKDYTYTLKDDYLKWQ